MNVGANDGLRPNEEIENVRGMGDWKLGYYSNVPTALLPQTFSEFRMLAGEPPFSSQA